MAHAQKPDFALCQSGRVQLKRKGASVQSTTGSRGIRMSRSNAGYTMFRGSVKSTGYLLNSPVSPTLPLPWVSLCHHISTEVCCKQQLFVYFDWIEITDALYTGVRKFIRLVL